MRLNNGVSMAEAERSLSDAEATWLDLMSDKTLAYWAYSGAVDKVHGLLARTFAEPDLAGELYSATFWHVTAVDPTRSTTQEDPRLIAREVKAQLATLESARLQLLQLRVLADRPGMPIVYDTNMLNHWQQPDGVLWRKVLSANGLRSRLVRLVIPMRVIDELDRQKYGHGDLARKAATAIRYLDRVFSDRDNYLPVEIRKGEATLEIWPDDRDRGRDTDADLEILRCASDLSLLLPNERTSVLTDDIGMRLRAQQMHLGTLRMPEEYRKPGTAIGETPPSPSQQ
jgi:hypothetical protein